MGFSDLKASLLKNSKEKGLATFLIALLTASCLFVPYMILSEGYFTFYGDFNVQMIPFYQEVHQAVHDGNIFWNWHTDLGANFIGSYSYYALGSPFFWLTIPFPNSFVPYLMGPLMILKFACAAFTSYLYIRRFTRTPNAACLGGLLYAFSGFSVYNIFFFIFHEAIVFFPLLLLSLELLITENKRFLFALTVCLCAVSNYFFFFGMVVFTVIYFFVRLFSKAIKIKFSRFLIVIFEAVLGLLLSAVILLPALQAISDNSRISETLLGWNAIMYGKEQIYANVLQCFFFPPDIPARPVFFPGAEVKWSSLGGWLPVFSMVGVFTLFSSKKGSWIKRVIGICVFMSLVPILNSAFYAFNTSYYARWYYMPILLMCLATVSLTEQKDIDWSFGYKWVLGITIAVSAVIGFFPQKNEDGKLIFGLYTQGDDLTYVFRYWIACLIAIISLVILWQLIKILKNDAKSFYVTATVCVCIISVIYGNVFIASGRAHSYDIKEIMIDSLIEGEVNLEDDSNFRIDTFDCVDNTAMFLGYSGINAFHSVVPASIMEFYKYIGVERSVGSRPDSEVYAIRPLLSVKYLLNREDGDSFIDADTQETKMSGYTYYKSEGGYHIFENDNYIPYGFSYDCYMDYDYCESYSENRRADMMLKAILLNDEQIEKYGDILENVEPEGSHRVYYTFEDDELKYDCDKLKATSAYYFETDNKGFTAKVTREKENLVFFSVPYDKGWSATVNGQKVDVEKVNVGFMAVKVPAGESVIRFNYETPLLKLGLFITGGSALLFVLYLLIFLIYNKYRKPQENYPEGDILLKSWKKQEAEEQIKETYVEPPHKSLFDDEPSIDIPKLDNGFKGGFKIKFDDSEE